VLLDMPPAMMAAKRYSFPVVTGITAQQSADERASRMRLYADFMNALTSTGTSAASQISEVDLSDPEDVRVLLPSAGSDLLVHLGSEDFAGRWQQLEQKLPGWRQQYPRLAGIDLRYQRQTVLEMSKATDDATSAATASSTSAQSAAKLASKTAAKPPARNHSTIQRAKAAPAHKTLQKSKPVRKTAHSAAAYREKP
jgi:cell division protein FtsQ